MKKPPAMTPAKMTVICNIQAIRGKIQPGYDPHEDFKALQYYDYFTLSKMQDSLIPSYNEYVKT